MLLGSYVCWAQTPAALDACAKLSDDKARLACFDRTVAAAKSTVGAAAPTASAAAPAGVAPVAAAPVVSAPAAAPASTALPPAAPPNGAAPAQSPAAPLTPEQKFGLSEHRVQQLENHGASPAPTAPAGVAAHIDSVTQNQTGRDVYTLDNGQVWRQLEPNPSFLVHPGQAVSIGTGALGSFWLSVSPRMRTRVTRLR